MIEMIEKTGRDTGVKLTISAAVHGNEKCGTKAIRRFLKGLDTGDIILEKGTIRFLPVCNPRAYDDHVRLIEDNLNRVIVKNDTPETYEQELAQHILPHLDWADMILDLHSYTAADVPFVIAEGDAALDFARHASCDFMVYGLTQMVIRQATKKTSHSVDAYGNNNAKPSCTVECGQHESPNSPNVAYQTILNILAHLGMIDSKHYKDNKSLTIYDSKSVVYKDRPAKFVKPWDNFEAVKAGALIGVYDDGEEMCVDQDCILFMPKDDAVLGAEWFYTATKRYNKT